MKKNVASQAIGVQMVSATDGSAFTGSVSVDVTIDNGTQASGAGTAPAHEGNGYHSYTPTQAETNGDHLAFTFTGTGAVPATIQMHTAFPQAGDSFDRIGASGAGLTNIGTIATVTNLTNLPSIPANWITAAGIAAGALDGKGDWNIGKTGYTVSTVSDKTGYSLSQAFPSNFADLSISATTGQVELLTATQASIDAVEADTNELQGDDIPTLIAALPTASEINAEMVDVMEVDTHAQPSSVPSATTTYQNMLSYAFTLGRNKMTQTSTTTLLRNDADSATIGTSTVSDDGTTFTKGKFV